MESLSIKTIGKLLTKKALAVSLVQGTGVDFWWPLHCNSYRISHNLN